MFGYKINIQAVDNSFFKTLTIYSLTYLLKKIINFDFHIQNLSIKCHGIKFLIKITLVDSHYDSIKTLKIGFIFELKLVI